MRMNETCAYITDWFMSSTKKLRAVIVRREPTNTAFMCCIRYLRMT